MADGDRPARVGGTVAAPGDFDREIHFGHPGAPGTWNGTNQRQPKANPVARTRLPEHGAVGGTHVNGSVWGRDTYYHAANQKDSLPEHQARRDAYPIICPSTT